MLTLDTKTSLYREDRGFKVPMSLDHDKIVGTQFCDKTVPRLLRPDPRVTQSPFFEGRSHLVLETRAWFSGTGESYNGESEDNQHQDRHHTQPSHDTTTDLLALAVVTLSSCLTDHPTKCYAL